MAVLLLTSRVPVEVASLLPVVPLKVIRAMLNVRHGCAALAICIHNAPNVRVAVTCGVRIHTIFLASALCLDNVFDRAMEVPNLSNVSNFIAVAKLDIQILPCILPDVDSCIVLIRHESVGHWDKG